jgi:uncharacterized RDD family membrane protein YckC
MAFHSGSVSHNLVFGMFSFAVSGDHHYEPQQLDLVYPSGGALSELSEQATDSVEEFEHLAMARPWPRFWSRLLDLKIWALPLGYGVGVLFPTQTLGLLANDEQGYLFGFLLMPLIMVVDAFCLALLGNTLGRAIVGIRVETIRHERLSVSTALNRNGQVYLKGLGLNIPIVSLFTLNSSFRKVNTGEQTSWDKDLYTRVYDVSSNPIRTMICAVVVVILIAAPLIIKEIDRQRQVAATGNPVEPPEDPIEKQLKDAADEVKPQMVDDITRLNGAAAEGRTFIFNYSITRRDMSDAAYSKFFADNIQPKVCTGKETSLMLKDYQVTYRYNYLMPNTSAPLSFEVKWADCLQ